ncbi:hypothetical protein SAY87_026110 [Trapa incisa]|uniref:WRKY domain-containing protein n=1 Tax=Trapa incisa TaxID=236973 RepID=A0AAN7GLL6_9MYRT|nr:hypothetical protein SAY87_026110 [Trapa incisa]
MNTASLGRSPGLPFAIEGNPFLDTSLDLKINSFGNPENHNPMGDAAREDDDGDIRRQGLSPKQKDIVSVEEFNRITAENKKLTEMLCRYGDLQSQMVPRKRKLEEYEWDNVIKICENSANSDEELYLRTQESTRTKVSRVYVQVDPSDMSLNVKDGYHWRKYGQKVTRDNPSPRAYFKCSFAPRCPVKKKVQRSVNNPSLLVATYEGEHNHRSPAEPKITSQSFTSKGQPNPVLVTPNPSSHKTNSSWYSNPSAALDLFPSPRQITNRLAKQPVHETKSEADSIKQLLVQQMVSSLTKDPNFAEALVTKISERIFEQEIQEFV